MYFNSDKEKKQRMAEFNKTEHTDLGDKLNLSYPDGAKEIADLLTFLPEDERVGIVNGFVSFMLLQ